MSPCASPLLPEFPARYVSIAATMYWLAKNTEKSGDCQRLFGHIWTCLHERSSFLPLPCLCDADHSPARLGPFGGCRRRFAAADAAHAGSARHTHPVAHCCTNYVADISTVDTGRHLDRSAHRRRVLLALLPQ